MASRYYLSVMAPNSLFEGAVKGTWALYGTGSQSWSPVQITYRLKSVKTVGGTQTNLNLWTNQQGNYDWFLRRWVTPVLAAQTISGTFDLCTMVRANWNVETPPAITGDSIVRTKIHIYIAVGQTTTVRHVLLDNYVDTVDYPTASQVWRSLASAQTLTPGDTVEGDVIVIEVGFRIVSSPTPAPTYPPGAHTNIRYIGTGVNSAFADAVAGDTSTSRVAWFEFSQTLTEGTLPDPPPNDDCADATVISSLPFQSDFLDTSQSAETARRTVWYSLTAPTTGVIMFDLFGTNYGAEIDVFSDGCTAAVNVNLIESQTVRSLNRLLLYEAIEAVAGQTYTIRIRGQATTAVDTIDSGGLLRLHAYYREDAQPGDLFFPCLSYITVIRGGVIVQADRQSARSPVTGCGFDYTRRPMVKIFNDGTVENDRFLVGLHNDNLTDIQDVTLLGRVWEVNSPEIDYINRPYTSSGAGSGNAAEHPAAIHVTREGLLYQAFFGNGYLFTSDTGTSGNRPAFFNAVSSPPPRAYLRVIDATHGDNQTGNPFAAGFYILPLDVTAPICIAIDEAASILYYTSGSVYIPVGGFVVKRFSLSSGAALSDLITLQSQGGNLPGAKGLTVHPDGSIFVCNNTVVHHVSAAGAILQTYTPSIPADAQALTDVKVTIDGLSIIAADLFTTRFFQWSIVSGVEEDTWQPYQAPGSWWQFAIYNPEEGCPVAATLSPGADSGGGSGCRVTL